MKAVLDSYFRLESNKTLSSMVFPTTLILSLSWKTNFGGKSLDLAFANFMMHFFELLIFLGFALEKVSGVSKKSWRVDEEERTWSGSFNRKRN